MNSENSRVIANLPKIEEKQIAFSIKDSDKAAERAGEGYVSKTEGNIGHGGRRGRSLDIRMESKYPNSKLVGVNIDDTERIIEKKVKRVVS